MPIQQVQDALERIFVLLRDPDFDLFKHGQLNEELEGIQKAYLDADSIQRYRHLSYAEMKGHRTELLENLLPARELLAQGNLQGAVQVLRANLKVLDQS